MANLLNEHASKDVAPNMSSLHEERFERVASHDARDGGRRAETTEPSFIIR
jgi:hypothetical protein